MRETTSAGVGVIVAVGSAGAGIGVGSVDAESVDEDWLFGVAVGVAVGVVKKAGTSNPRYCTPNTLHTEHKHSKASKRINIRQKIRRLEDCCLVTVAGGV